MTNIDKVSRVYLGKRTENLTTELMFDCSSWYELCQNGTISLMVRRPGEDTLYPVPLTRDGDVNIWHVTSSDTDIAGYGYGQFMLMDGDTVKLSHIFSTEIEDNLDGNVREPIPPEEPWIQRVVELTQRSPYIDPESHTWFIWNSDEDKYIDTGINAMGLKGDTGEQGEKGEKGDKGDPGAINFIVVTSLPETGDPTAIYLLLKQSTEEQNVYDEFIWTNDRWERLGENKVEVDLSPYRKASDQDEIDNSILERVASLSDAIGTKVTIDNFPNNPNKGDICIKKFAENLVSNGDFTLGFEDWEHHSSSTIEHTGDKYYAHLNDNSSTDILLRHWFTLPSAGEYRIKFDVRGTDKVTMEILDSQWRKFSENIVKINGTWTTHTIDVNVSTYTNPLNIIFFHSVCDITNVEILKTDGLDNKVWGYDGTKWVALLPVDYYTKTETDNLLDDKVDDVQINGTSIVTDGVAEIPKAQINGGNGQLGVVGVKTTSYSGGITVDNDGYIRLYGASESQIDNRTPAFYGFLPNQIPKIIKSGMTSTTDPAWTEQEQKNACARMGTKYNDKLEIIEEITLEDETNVITRSIEPDGTPYNLKRIYVFIKFPLIDETKNITNLSVWAKNSRYKVYYSGSQQISSAYGHYREFLYTMDIVDDITYYDGYFAWDDSYVLESAMKGGKYSIPIIVDSEPIKTINISGTSFPIGTNIKIYGVRA